MQEFAKMTENLAMRWMLRYKLFFLIGLLILAVQVFLAYKSLSIADLASSGVTQARREDTPGGVIQINSASDDAEVNALATQMRAKQRHIPSSSGIVGAGSSAISPGQLGFFPKCDINAKETISALQRARTKDCRKHIADIACAIQTGHFYADHLPNYCPTNRTANAPLGCYRDEKKFRLLSGYFANFKSTNTPHRCTQLCLQSGYPYAGVQYGSECFCGAEAPPTSAKLADSGCNMKCTGDGRTICGGYYSMNIYETGIAKFAAKTAETSVATHTERVKIAFLLTLNGRALRQVHRLIRALYSPRHFFYIHVDARQDYLYRKLLELENKFVNVRLARRRFATIWGGASLLTMLLQCMNDLLDAADWQWDFIINLSESDFPVKAPDKLVDFLTANRGRNFVKSHGRETQRFIQKQGLDKTFVECDTHMWRIGDRQLPAGIQVDGGSDWVALSRPFVSYVIKQANSDVLLQGLLVIFRHTLLPAESFFHTVLRNSRYCDTYVDNNLHVTNWKRKLGCKCQYKHVVDWCGCSPNDFKIDDWARLQGTEQKQLFFARKFEPIISQGVLSQLEEWLFGVPDASAAVNLHSYWQSMYDHADPFTPGDDLTLSVGESLMRAVVSRLDSTLPLRPDRLLELTNYMHRDQYKGFLQRFAAVYATTNSTLELEARVCPVQYVKLAKSSKFAKRFRNLDVSSDFDLKEQVARNYAKFLGPYSEPVLSYTFVGAGVSAASNDAAHSYNLTLLWIDPAGRLQDFSEIHMEDATADAVNFSKSQLKQPLMPGIWTARLIGRAAVFAQLKFLVTPMTVWAGRPITAERALIVNAGGGLTLPVDFALPKEWHAHLPNADEKAELQQLALENTRRVGDSLLAWTDELVAKFYHQREVCVVTGTTDGEKLPLCAHTQWSSLAPDPKSDIDSLLGRR